jgi:predicted nucleic acid-binding protein
LSRVVDTSYWVEWIAGKLRSEAARKHMPPPADCIVPTIVQFELVKWARREGGMEAAERILGFTMLCNIVPLDTRIAASAAEFSRLHKLPTADAIIYATAIGSEADLLTCDQHFEGLASVIYLAKEA